MIAFETAMSQINLGIEVTLFDGVGIQYGRLSAGKFGIRVAASRDEGWTPWMECSRELKLRGGRLLPGLIAEIHGKLSTLAKDIELFKENP